MGRLVPVYLCSSLLHFLQHISLFNISMLGAGGGGHRNIFLATVVNIPNSFSTDSSLHPTLPPELPAFLVFPQSLLSRMKLVVVLGTALGLAGEDLTERQMARVVVFR